jgi:hypothetical protein
MGHPLSSHYPEVEQYQRDEISGHVMDMSRAPDLAISRDPARARQAFEEATNQYMASHQIPPAGNHEAIAAIDPQQILAARRPVPPPAVLMPPRLALYHIPHVLQPPDVFRQPVNGPLIPLVPGTAYPGYAAEGNKKKNFIGFPLSELPAPAHLSCYEVCQQWPNSLINAGLDAFLQRNWSAKEIAACLAPNIQAWLEVNGTLENPTWITNRLNSRRNRVLISTGDWDPLIQAKETNPLRADGRPDHMPRMKSAKDAENAKWFLNP